MSNTRLYGQCHLSLYRFAVCVGRLDGGDHIGAIVRRIWWQKNVHGKRWKDVLCNGESLRVLLTLYINGDGPVAEWRLLRELQLLRDDASLRENPFPLLN